MNKLVKPFIRVLIINFTKVKESASKTIQDRATNTMLVERDNKGDSLEEFNSLSHTPIKAYHTAVLGCNYWNWLRV